MSYNPYTFNNPYNQMNFNPYMQQPSMQQSVNQMQNQQIQQPVQQSMFKPAVTSLQGKSVDSIDVVKAMDIPLDGSISYFPLTDNTAIVTKQLQPDGTSKTMVYKPVEIEAVEEKETPKYMTIDEFNEEIKKLDNTKDLKEEIKSLKKQIKNLTDELDELKDKED